MSERTIDQWIKELYADFHCITLTLKSMYKYGEPETARSYAYMRKEARRMVRDIERMAEVAGFSRDDLDNVGPL